MSVGSQVGAYRIIEQIGEGGMGSVWLAEHMTIGRRAAVKMLHGEFSGRQEIVQRFFNEARAATQITDPGIVQIFDFGTTPEGRAFIVMELLDGEPLDRRLARVGKLPVHDSLRIMRQVASTLGAAHARGIVHRDLKPENIFMVRDPEVPGGERAKILDFGIAKLSDNAGVKTQTNAIMGTPQYMSPEQCRGSGKVDARSDVYALGCVMTALITGEPPFVAEGPGELIVMHLQQSPPPLSSRVPHVPPAVEQVVARCLAKNVDERFASGLELAQALAMLITSTSQPPGSPIALGPQSPTIALGPTTTLTGAAGQAASTVPPPSSSKKGLVFAIVGLLVVGGGVAGVMVAKSGSSDSTPPVAAKDPAPMPVTPPNPVPAPAPAPVPPPAPVETKPADPPPAPAKLSVTIASKPASAQVFVGSEKTPRGTTPYTLELDKDSAPVEVKLVAKGYAPKKTKIVPGETTDVAVTLDKLAVAAPSHPTTTTQPADTSPGSTDDTMNPFAKKK